MGMRSKVYLFLLALLVLCAAGYFGRGAFPEHSFGSTQTANDVSLETDSQAVPVAVEVAVRGAISHSLTSTANLRALRAIEITTRAAGIITAVNVEEGDFVRKGQVLCSLDDRELQIDLALAQQKLAQTKIKLEAARIRKEQTETQIRNKRVELERNELALAEGLLAESEVALERHQIDDLIHERRVTESTVRESQHKIEELEFEIRKVRLRISQTSVTAPFGGRITDRSVELGQSVRVADKLFELAAFSELYADVHLAERDSRSVEPGQRARILLGAGEDEEARGGVVRVSPVVDEETGTVKVTAKLRPPNPAFRPGAFVRVEIETDTRGDVVLIPKQAVLEEDGESFVVVIDPLARALRKAVDLGYQSDSMVEVRSGIEEGETVVTAGQGKLKDGDATRVVSN